MSYRFSSSLIQDGKRTRRAAARNRNILWANKTIPITFSNTTDVNTRFLIAKAIKEIEQETCLKFSLRTDEEDYIEFTGDSSGCASYVGRRGGKQTITLPEFDYGTCRTHGIIIHETCHALGMWHEQSRPDRDLYVAVLEDNIKAGKEHNFRRRSTLDVDYRGEAYDYGSIMHYRLSSFSSSGSPTLKVTNTTEYNHQGKPTIGQRKGLSKSDIIQLNRMYNCQGSGLRGNLEVYIKNGFNVPGRSSYADRYVKIAAVDDRGVKETLTTRYIYGSYYLLWNQWLDFGRRSWQYIEVSLWDNRFLGPDAEHDRLTETQTFSINPGYHSNIQHCNDKNCSIKLVFDYNLIQESDARTQCDPNPCLHGGTCWQFTSSKSYECSCPENYSGPHCEFITGNLLVYAYRGYNLLNSDGKDNKSDPYLYLVAHDKDGNSKHIRSTSVTDNDNPRWYQLLYFGYGHWKTFDVSIWDEDEGADDSLSDVSTYHLPSYYTSRSYVKKSGYNGGYVYFNYHFRQS